MACGGGGVQGILRHYRILLDASLLVHSAMYIFDTIFLED